MKFSSTLEKNPRKLCAENADKPLSEVLPLDDYTIRSQSKVQHVGGAACQ